MEMSSGHNPSFTWRSIVSFKVVLKEWFWWKLGDEVSIDVWKQPWLRSTNVAYIQTPMYPRMEDLKVSDLIDYHSGHWNNPLIDNLFEAGDVRASYPTCSYPR